jgi:hypothetical protein
MSHFQRSKWNKPYPEPVCPITGLPLWQEFEMDAGTVEAVRGPFPNVEEATRTLNEAQKQQERIARLGEVRPGRK